MLSFDDFNKGGGGSGREQENSQELKSLLRQFIDKHEELVNAAKITNSEQRFDASDEIEADLFGDEQLQEIDDNSLSFSDARLKIKENRYLQYLEAQKVKVSDFVRAAMDAEPIDIVHRWHAMKERTYYPRNKGSLSCAYFLCTVLGMGDEDNHSEGKIPSVSKLIPRLIATNLKNRGKEGIVLGMKNFQEGDVIVFGAESSSISSTGEVRRGYAEGGFGHVGIVRGKSSIDVKMPDGSIVKEDYLAVYHSSTSGGMKNGLQVVLVPVDRNSKSARYLSRELSDPSKLSLYASENPLIATLMQEKGKRTLRVVHDNTYWKDSSTGKGTVAFAIRTKFDSPEELAWNWN